MIGAPAEVETAYPSGDAGHIAGADQTVLSGEFLSTNQIEAIAAMILAFNVLQQRLVDDVQTSVTRPT